MNENKFNAIFTFCITIVMMTLIVTVYMYNVRWSEVILKGGYFQDVNGRWVKPPMNCGKEQ